MTIGKVLAIIGLVFAVLALIGIRAAVPLEAVAIVLVALGVVIG